MTALDDRPADLHEHVDAPDDRPVLDKRAARRAKGRQDRAERRRERRERRGERARWWAAVRARLIPVAPLLVVNAFAVLGQFLTGLDNYSPPAWAWPARVAVAIGAAAGFESISLYVQWHAHDALLLKATHTAARMRRGAYLIAFGTAAVSYHHFAAGWLRPTAASIVFATFSACSPWLWGLHTRRAHRIQLLREGQVDSTGAVFSAERWRAFPIRTWRARRLSIDLGISDPADAWDAYKSLAAQRADQRHTDSGGTAPVAELAAHDREPDDGRATNDGGPELAANGEPVLHLAPPPGGASAGDGPADDTDVAGDGGDEEDRVDDDVARARRLLIANVGRPRLCEELGIHDPGAKVLKGTAPDKVTAELLAELRARAAASEERRRQRA